MNKQKWLSTAALASALILVPAFASRGWADPPPALARALDELRVGEPQRMGSLTVLPLLGGGWLEELGYATLEQALARGWLEITEKDGGSVPEVLMTNRSNRVIFILGGEILSGARQDRIVRDDLLLSPGRKRLPVPVYCVEEGRWHPKGQSFGSEQNFGTYRLRAKAQAGGPEAQSEVWAEVALAGHRAGVASPTGAYQDTYRDPKVARRLEELERVLSDLPRRYPDAAGVIVAAGGQVLSVDLFGSASLFRELWPKILKSTALAALQDSDGSAGGFTTQKAAELLRRLRRADFRAREALDLGVLYISADQLRSAAALLHQGALVHLGVFALH
jgi:hypothetical protein